MADCRLRSRLKIYLDRTMQICAYICAHVPYLNGSEFSNWHRCFLFGFSHWIKCQSSNILIVHMLKMCPTESSWRSFVHTTKASCYKNKCGCMWYSHSYIIRISAAVPVVSALKEWSVGWMIITTVCDITELSNQRGTKCVRGFLSQHSWCEVRMWNKKKMLYVTAGQQKNKSEWNRNTAASRGIPFVVISRELNAAPFAAEEIWNWHLPSDPALAC